MRGTFRGGLALALIAGAVLPASAQDDISALRKQMEAERAQFRRAMAAYEARMRALERRTRDLEKKQTETAAEKTAAANSGALPGSAPPQPPAQATAPGTFRVQGPLGDMDFRIGAVVTSAGAFSSVANRIARFLMPGHHDPLGNGFTLQGAELMIDGVVDPYFDGAVRASFKIDSNGETETELEEAYLRTRNLPGGLQVKAGQFYTEFGRINAMHPHEWAFVNQNVVTSRMFGEDGMRGLGAQVSWLTPLPWFSQIIVSLQNGKGGAMHSFLGEAGTQFGPAAQGDRDIRTFAQLVKAFRWVNGFDITDEIAANIGASFAFGSNATGSSANTYIAGADLYVKWTPTRNTRGFPFVSAQFEYIHRWFQASFADAISGDLRRQTLRDYGFYAQFLYGFQPELPGGYRPDVAAGLRIDYASSNGDSSADPFRALRWRVSPNITWFPTERSKVRLQYDYDWAQHLGRRESHTVMLQLEFALGAHGAHKF